MRLVLDTNVLISAVVFGGAPRGLLRRLIRRESAGTTHRALELLEYLGIVGLRDQLASNLSYGQQKLLDFGMALMSRPEVILLDEPLAGVNPTMIKSPFTL